MDRLDDLDFVAGSVGLLGLPFDAHSSFVRGTADAPPRIRHELHSDAGNLWSESGVDLGAASRLVDFGDLELPEDHSPDEAVRSAVAGVIEHGLVPLCLGGDHSLTYPVVAAVSAAVEGLSLIQFDAHPDLYDTFQGRRDSHACPMARIMEQGFVRRLVQVGIRAMNGHQRQQAERFGVEVIEMGGWAVDRLPRVEGPLYLSLDLDALDPAHAPGVGHPEPGGLTTRQLIDAIHALRGTLVGADVVELNPSLDPAGLTARVAAKLVKELAARLLADSGLCGA
jgi:agmatinase